MCAVRVGFPLSGRAIDISFDAHTIEAYTHKYIYTKHIWLRIYTYDRPYSCLSPSIADTEELMPRCCVTGHSLPNFVLNRCDKFGFKALTITHKQVVKWFELNSYFMLNH